MLGIKEKVFSFCEQEGVKRFVPLFLVFISGLGFSIQSLTIKKLEEDTEYSASFQLIFVRGASQLIMALYFIYSDEENMAKSEPFGTTPYVQRIMALRSLVGYGGIAFAFLGIENLPLGDATVLVMLSPLFASIFSFFVMGETFGKAEASAILISLTGVVLISRPSFIFGGDQSLPIVGVMYAMIASVCAGAAYTSIRLLGTTAKMPWANVCLAQAIGQVVLSLPSAYIAGQKLKWLTLSSEQWLGIFGAGFLGCWSQIAMTVGMQKEKSATATGMRMSDVFFGFVWQVLFTSENVLNPLSVFGACLVVSSIFVLVFSKSMGPAAVPTATSRLADGVSTDVEMATKAHGEVYSALRSELSESEHMAEDDSVTLARAREKQMLGEEEKQERLESYSDKENLRGVMNTPSHSGAGAALATPDTVDAILGKESVFIKDSYAALAGQFDGDADDLPGAAWGSSEEDDERWECDFDALKREFDV